MNLKPYKPCPIEGYDVALTSRQKLAHIRKVLADAKEAKRYWPFAEWTALIADLERQEAALAADPGKPYAIYRRDYPHKPKWIVADRNHRVIALLPWRVHAQTVADELNLLAAK